MAALIIAAALVSLAAAYIRTSNHAHIATNPSAKKLSYWLDNHDPSLTGAIESQITKAGLAPAFTNSKTDAAVVITSAQEPGGRIAATRITGSPNSLGTDTLIRPTPQPAAWVTVGPTAPPAAKTVADAIAANPTELSGAQWSLIATSDIIIGRMVYWRMMQTGDMLMPFAKFRNTLADADLTLANLENSFSDTHPVISQEGMSFVSPTKAAAGLADSGIDAVNIANNHSYNGGASGFNETLDWLAAHNIAVFGGGPSDQAAHTPLVKTVKGTRIAMLGYSSIVGSVAAGPDTPGMAYISMAPWGTLDESQVERMEQDIRAAKKQADVVLVYYHWGTEYTHDANADQRTVAHRAIDAGADVIVGTHPHVVQGVEWYHNRLITYSLGNFIFDQEWSVDTTRGVLLSLGFTGKTVTSAKLIPYQIADYNQPQPASAATASSILSDINSHSWWSP